MGQIILDFVILLQPAVVKLSKYAAGHRLSVLETRLAESVECCLAVGGGSHHCESEGAGVVAGVAHGQDCQALLLPVGVQPGHFPDAEPSLSCDLDSNVSSNGHPSLMGFESGCEEDLRADPVSLDNVLFDIAVVGLLAVVEHDDQRGPQPLLLLHAIAGLMDLPDPFFDVPLDHLDAGLLGQVNPVVGAGLDDALVELVRLVLRLLGREEEDQLLVLDAVAAIDPDVLRFVQVLAVVGVETELLLAYPHIGCFQKLSFYPNFLAD